MTQHDDAVYLNHILDMTRKIEKMTFGMPRDLFESDDATLFGTLHALQIVGEAARRISAETRAQLSDVPWTTIIGMRHKIVHDYFEIDFDIVWKVINSDLKPLNDEIERYLASSTTR